MEFPDLTTILALEIQVAGEWRDVTGNLTTPLPIQYGRANESGGITPSEVSFELDNRTGIYTPDHPASPYWPHIRLGLPVRVSLDTDSLTTPGGYAEGFETGLGGWSALAGTAAVSTAHAHAGAQSLMVSGGTTGQAAQSPQVPAVAGAHQHMSLWLYREQVTGEPLVSLGGAFVDANGETLLVLDVVTVAVPPGQWTRASIGGLAPPRTAALFIQVVSYSPALWLDTAATRHGADFHRGTRFLGEVSSIEPFWPTGDPAGDDEPETFVAVTASGITRRLGQGAPVLRSALARGMPGRSSSQVAYWPVEDGAAADHAAAGLPDGAPMTVAAGRAVDFAALDAAPGSAPLPNMTNSSATLTGTVPARRFPDRTWLVSFLVYLEGPETWPALEVSLNGSRYDTIRVSIGTRVTVTGYPDDAASVTLMNSPTPIADTGPRWLGIGLTELGNNETQVNLTLDGRFVDEAYVIGRFAGRPTHVRIRPRTSGGAAAIGHVEVSNSASASSSDPRRVAGHAGETAGERMERLCKEEGVPLSFIGDPDDTIRVGPQRVAKLLELLTDAADADAGILSEALHRPGLIYRTRASLYNQTPAITLDANSSAGGDIVNPFRPVLDDRSVRNDVTASRTEGGSYRATAETGPMSVQPAPAGIGRYDEQVSVHVDGDAQLPGIAGWRLHLGTAPGMRYPVISPALDTAPHLIGAWLGLRLGDRLDVTNLPAQHPAGRISLLAQGYNETLTPTSWEAQLNASPGGPWQVATRAPAIWDALTADRYDTAGAQLSQPATAAATTVTVRTTTGPRWITTTERPNEFPFTVSLGGEVLRVTGISGTGAIQTFTVTRAAGPSNRAHPAGTPVQLARPAHRAL